MFLCENAIYTQSAMENVLTHELIHAYDNCRIKYDPDNVKHLACTEVLVFTNFSMGIRTLRYEGHEQPKRKGWSRGKVGKWDLSKGKWQEFGRSGSKNHYGKEMLL